MLKNILKKVHTLEISAVNTIDSLFSGNYKSAFRGRGIEFADIRKYDTGDDVRDIDWKTSSKQGEIFVKTYHESRDNTVFFIIDGTSVMQFSSQKEKKYEYLLEAFSLLAFSAVKNGDRVGALLYTDSFFSRGQKQKNIKIFPPKGGRKNILHILQCCIETYTNVQQGPQKKPFTPNLAELFQLVFRLLKHSSSLFWLTGEIPSLSPQIQKNITLLRSKHDFIPGIFQDALEENFTKRGTFSFQGKTYGATTFLTVTDAVAREFRALRAEKKRKFQVFLKKGRSQSLFFSPGKSIFSTLFTFFQNRQKLFL
jgi:uncharacterized protein (DUF58 family)